MGKLLIHDILEGTNTSKVTKLFLAIETAPLEWYLQQRLPYRSSRSCEGRRAARWPRRRRSRAACRSRAPRSGRAGPLTASLQRGNAQRAANKNARSFPHESLFLKIPVRREQTFATSW